MRVLTTRSFLDIVADPDNVSNVLVRACCMTDITDVLDVEEDTIIDGQCFRFQVSVPRHMAMGAIASQILGIEYQQMDPAIRSPQRARLANQIVTAAVEFQAETRKQELIRAHNRKTMQQVLAQPARHAKPVLVDDGWPLRTKE